MSTCGCDKIKSCRDVCECISIESSDSSIIVKRKSNGALGCEIDLKANIPPVTPETIFNASSNSLVITPGGPTGHTPNIELVPSGSEGNALLLSSDGRPFVRKIVIENGDVVSFEKTVIDGVLYYKPIVDNSGLISTDAGNEIVQGTDGKLFSQKIHIENIPGLSFTTTVVGGELIYTPVIDWAYFAEQICKLCIPPPPPLCLAPQNLLVTLS